MWPFSHEISSISMTVFITTTHHWFIPPPVSVMTRLCPVLWLPKFHLVHINLIVSPSRPFIRHQSQPIYFNPKVFTLVRPSIPGPIPVPSLIDFDLYLFCETSKVLPLLPYTHPSQVLESLKKEKDMWTIRRIVHTVLCIGRLLDKLST